MKKQSGFSLVEGILLILMLVFVGFGGWYVWNQNKDDKNAAVSQSTTEATDNKDTDRDADVANDETEGWSTYANEELGFTFKYPPQTEITARDGADYFEVTGTKSDGNSPARNVFGNGNYKIQIQVYSNGLSVKKTLDLGADGTLTGSIETVDGIERAIAHVSSEEARGPSYDIYWLGKDGKVISVTVYGNPTFEIKDLVSTLNFL